MRSEWLMGFMIIRSTLEIITKKMQKKKIIIKIKMHDPLFLYKLHNFEKKNSIFLVNNESF